MGLYYDGEYREGDADFEPCFPVRKEIVAPGISFHQVEGGRCLTLIHRGPYDQIGRSYGKLLKHAAEAGVKFALPAREVYVKGPGMIFRRAKENTPLSQSSPEHSQDGQMGILMFLRPCQGTSHFYPYSGGCHHRNFLEPSGLSKLCGWSAELPLRRGWTVITLGVGHF